MYIRPHHFYCSHFITYTFPERGHEFQEAWENLKKLLEDLTTNIDIGHGPDSICTVCQFFDGHECTSPLGDEKAVMKWDAKLISELSLEEGQRLNISQLNELIDKGAPLSFCINRCPHYRNNFCNPSKPDIKGGRHG